MENKTINKNSWLKEIVYISKYKKYMKRNDFFKKEDYNNSDINRAWKHLKNQLELIEWYHLTNFKK